MAGGFKAETCPGGYDVVLPEELTLVVQGEGWPQPVEKSCLAKVRNVKVVKNALAGRIEEQTGINCQECRKCVAFRRSS